MITQGVPPTTREHLRTGMELRCNSSISLKMSPGEARWLKRRRLELVGLGSRSGFFPNVR
jgi:hypothetical protein